MKIDKCLRAWLEFYRETQELAPDGLLEATHAILLAHERATKKRSASLTGNTNKKKRSTAERRRIAKTKGSLALVAENNGISPQTVANYRKEFSKIV